MVQFYRAVTGFLKLTIMAERNAWGYYGVYLFIYFENVQENYTLLLIDRVGFGIFLNG